MREIEFRGRTAKGEWVYGAYYKQEHFYGDEEEVHCIITTKDVLSNDLGLDYEEVIPETVGQYVGIKDKHGKKVYEGDIVKSKNEYVDETVYLVAYRDCGFKLIYRPSNGVVNLTNNKSRYIEVIGTVFDKESDNGD